MEICRNFFSCVSVQTENLLNHEIAYKRKKSENNEIEKPLLKMKKKTKKLVLHPAGVHGKDLFHV
jgi:hypothetical protein